MYSVSYAKPKSNFSNYGDSFCCFSLQQMNNNVKNSKLFGKFVALQWWTKLWIKICAIFNQTAFARLQFPRFVLTKYFSLALQIPRLLYNFVDVFQSITLENPLTWCQGAQQQTMNYSLETKTKIKLYAISLSHETSQLCVFLFIVFFFCLHVRTRRKKGFSNESIQICSEKNITLFYASA